MAAKKQSKSEEDYGFFNKGFLNKGSQPATSKPKANPTTAAKKQSNVEEEECQFLNKGFLNKGSQLATSRPNMTLPSKNPSQSPAEATMAPKKQLTLEEEYEFLNKQSHSFFQEDDEEDYDGYSYEDYDGYGYEDFDYEHFDDYSNPFHEDYMEEHNERSASTYLPPNISIKDLKLDDPKEEEDQTADFEEDLDALIRNGGEETNQALLKLPLGIFLNIISRLPIKPLAIGRCVSKTWRSVIHYPRFIEMHHKRVIQEPHIFNSTTSLLLYISRSLPLVFNDCYPVDRPLSELHFLERVKDDSFDKGVVVSPQIKPSKLIFKGPELKFEFVGSCNGLVCMGEPFNFDPIYVYNPVGGEYVVLPDMVKKTECGITSGFGYDHVADKYKVVRIYYIVDRNGGPILKAEVLTLGSRRWRNLGDIPQLFMKQSVPTFVNGALHWISTSDTSEVAAAFDVGREQFRGIPPPPNVTPGRLERLGDLAGKCLGNLGGKLCFFDYSSKQCDIWMMADYGVGSSWTKQYVVPRKISGFRSKVDFTPVTLMKNGNILLVVDNAALVCYDPGRKSFTKLQIGKLPRRFEATTHVGSFISLNDIVGPATSNHGTTSKRWYGISRPISSQIDFEMLLRKKLRENNKEMRKLWWESHS